MTSVSREPLSQELLPFNPAGWISAAETIALVRQVTNSHYSAQMIARRAFAGLLRAHAETMICGDVSENDAMIPKEFWWAEGEAARSIQLQLRML